MGVSAKTVGRSILESMFFLAVMSGLILLFYEVPSFKKLGLSALAFFPIVCAITSAIVGYTFPKPSFKLAFLKLVIGGHITLLIFVGLTLILGPTVFTAVLDFLWDGGSYAWNHGAVEGVIAGIFAVIFYGILTVILVGMIFAGLFALTNFLVLLAMNAYVDRNDPIVAIAEANSPVAPSPFTPASESKAAEAPTPEAPRGETPFS